MRSLWNKYSLCHYNNNSLHNTDVMAAKDNGLECTCVNNGDFTVLVSGGGRYS